MSNERVAKNLIRYFLLLLAIGCFRASVAGEESAAATIRAMTGAHTRIVWTRSSNNAGSPFGPTDNNNKTWRIIVLDTDEGKERVLQSEPGTYNHVMITPSGARVIWTDMDKHIGICDWDGKNSRKLMDATMALGVAEDPPGTEWVYIDEGKRVKASNTDQIAEVWRYQIDNLAKKELVWDKTGANDKWEFTRDGKFGASGLPWPNAGIAQLPNGTLKTVGVGCTPGLAADASIVTHLNPMGHGGLFLYNPDGSGKRYFDIRNTCPGREGINDPQFWWASFVRYDKRFFTFAGPFPSLSYRGTKTNIYFCAFNDKFNGVSKWFIVSADAQCQTHPYAWIEPPDITVRNRSKKSIAKKDEKTEAAASDKWPSDSKGVVFLWDGKSQPPAPELQQRGAAKLDGSSLSLEGGSFAADVGKQLKAEISQQFSLEVQFTPGKTPTGLGEIVSFSSGSDQYNFLLGQDGNQLVLGLATLGQKEKPAPLRLCPLVSGEPCHIAVTYEPGILSCYKNGKMVMASMDLTGNLSNWEERHFVFGANWDAQHPWNGKIDAVALYNRALSGKEAKLNCDGYSLRVKNRQASSGDEKSKPAP